MVLCHSCLKWLRTTTKTKSKLIAWIYMLTWYHLVGRKTRKPPEPVTTNIPVLCLLSLSPWGSRELLEGQLVFFSSFCFIVWGLVCCQGRVCVCGWVNKLWRNILRRRMRLKNELDWVVITRSNPASLRAAWVIVKRQERKIEQCKLEANDWKKKNKTSFKLIPL